MSTPHDRQPWPPARLLLLEDDAPFCSVLVELFASEGFDVAAYHSYASLRQALDGSGGAIVVADFWGASHASLGPSERDAIRDLGSRATIILLTGRAWATTVTAEELNVACILPKPVALDDLVAQVRRCLEATQDPA